MATVVINAPKNSKSVLLWIYSPNQMHWYGARALREWLRMGAMGF